MKISHRAFTTTSHLSMIPKSGKWLSYVVRCNLTFRFHSHCSSSSRSLPHECLQDHLDVSTSPRPDSTYVCDDWVTVAVVAGRGPIKLSTVAVTIEADDEGRKTDAKGKGKQKQQPLKPSGKKYVNMKLVDFGSRSHSASSATGGKAVIRWNAFLSSLFESDGFDVGP